MTKLKTFFYVFKNSAFKPQYYAQVLKAPFSFSLKYFLSLFILMSLIIVFSLNLVLITQVNPLLNKLKDELPRFYPENLEVSIKDGTVTTNQEEPYFIPLKLDWLPKEIRGEEVLKPVQNLMVIDTQAQPQEIKKYQTLSLLTKNDFTVADNKQTIRITSLEQVKDLTVNKKVVEEIIDKITPLLKRAIPIIIISSLIFVPLFLIISKFSYLAFVSLLTLLLALLFKNKPKGFNFKKALQLNLHAITLPTVIAAVFYLLAAPPRLPFFQTIVLLIFNAIILASLRSEK